MSEDFTEEFVIEEEEGPNRSFLIIAGSMIGLFILIAAVVLGYFLIQGGDDRSAEISARETENAQTLAENALVTQTVVALTQEADAQQEAASEEPTEEPTRRLTLDPTNTPLSGGEGAAAGGQASPTNTPEPEEPTREATEAVAEAEAASDATPTLAAAAAGDGGTTGSAAAADGQLPQTGLDTATLVGAGLALFVLLVLARFLRAR